MTTEDKDTESKIDKLTRIILDGRDDIHVFSKKHVESLLAIVEVYDKNPKAIEAWVWLYDTAFRFKSVGNFFIGVVKWLLLLGGSFLLFKENGIIVAKTLFTNIYKLFGN